MKYSKPLILIITTLLLLSFNTSAQTVSSNESLIEKKYSSITTQFLLIIYQTLKHTTSQLASTHLLQDWKQALFTHLSRYKRYPRIARKANEQGIVSTRFTIDAEGNVIKVTLHKSSGSVSLDNATLNMIKQASPVPKPPLKLLKTDGTLTLSVPISFNLNVSKQINNER